LPIVTESEPAVNAPTYAFSLPFTKRSRKWFLVLRECRVKDDYDGDRRSSFSSQRQIMDLFQQLHAENLRKAQPLAARMRPRTVDEFVGQEHFFGPGKLLRRLLQADRLGSLIFYGPPGTGKTALAHVIANQTQCAFRPLNAVAAGVKEVRELLAEARAELEATGRRTILFVDELHRFNRAQQDVLLPD